MDEVDHRGASSSNRQQPEVITMNDDNDKSCQLENFSLWEKVFDFLPLTDLLQIDQVTLNKAVVASQQFVC